MASRAWWAGAIVGGILGLLVGLAIGYSQVGQTVVIPLSDGVRA